MVSVRKVIFYENASVRETLCENDIQNITSCVGVRDMMRPSSFACFTSEVQELRKSSLGGPADRGSVKVSGCKLCFSNDGCNLHEGLDQLRELKFVC